MSLFGAFDKTKHFDELDEPLFSAEGTLDAAARRLRALRNITGSSDIVLADMQKLADVTASAAALNSGSLGTAGTAEAGAVAVELGSGNSHTTVLTLTNFAVGTSGDAAAKAIGALLYTFPSGDILVESAQFAALGITAAISVTTDTPEVGLGTTVASGVNATLGAVAATAENISEGGDTTNIAPDVAGTATINSTKRPGVASGDDGPLRILSAGVHTVYFNVADTWNDVSAAGAVTATGTVILNWKRVA